MKASHVDTLIGVLLKLAWVVVGIAVLSLAGCERRPCVRQACQREAVIVVVNSGIGVPIYDEVCHCVEYGDGGVK